MQQLTEKYQELTEKYQELSEKYEELNERYQELSERHHDPSHSYLLQVSEFRQLNNRIKELGTLLRRAIEMAFCDMLKPEEFDAV